MAENSWRATNFDFQQSLNVMLLKMTESKKVYAYTFRQCLSRQLQLCQMFLSGYCMLISSKILTNQ